MEFYLNCRPTSIHIWILRSRTGALTIQNREEISVRSDWIYALWVQNSTLSHSLTHKYRNWQFKVWFRISSHHIPSMLDRKNEDRMSNDRSHLLPEAKHGRWIQSLPSLALFPSSDSQRLSSLSAVFSSYDNWEFLSIMKWLLRTDFDSDRSLFQLRCARRNRHCSRHLLYRWDHFENRIIDNCRVFRQSFPPSSLTFHSEWSFSFHSSDSTWQESMAISWLCPVLSSLLSTPLSCYTSWEGSSRDICEK